ncbi:enhancer of mRNA-decapping protein 4 [Bombina bombina]|uniref:enhancer of mRNA-decapping protein 4 n=1 Tax=Bombina bombina TaxID=8345 RepID=UPI00235A498F|nr:enhancer of mRNA-decapping protein 4 [Bombina bombina]
MAAASSIDIDATQHLRDILKLDRPGDSASEPKRKSNSFNGDLNGLLVPDPVTTDASLPDSGIRNVPMVTASDRQVICLSGDDSSSCIEITGTDVEIVASNDSNICSKARGSNKVKIQPVAKYDWEQKYYYGNLIAVSNAYLAYAIRGANGSAMVRVLSVTTAERILLKGITGSVTDLAFAHLNSNQLACLDEAGNLFVWRLTMEKEKILEEIVVHIKRPDSTPLNSFRRIIWCPYIPEENEEPSPEDASQTLALLHEDRAEVWDLEIVRANHSSWPAEVNDVKDGFIVVKGHTGRVSEGALSPDGTVLATASHDGYVKFWQIYIEGQDQPSVNKAECPRCLHEWKPHNGRPLSCLLFCDNHKKQDPDVPFWRFLITGADQNKELKMWCTVSWTCLQTIRFSPDPFSSSVLPGLKASLDLSAEFLILTDVQRKVLYVMELIQNQDEGKASFTSISEFLLTHPVLSFGIQDVSRCRLRHTEVLPAEEESDGINQEESQETEAVESAAGVLIKLFCVHTKALQDVQIWFQPHQIPESAALITPRRPHEDFGIPDHLADLGGERLPSAHGSLHGSQPDLRRLTTDFILLPADPKPKLMTPDAFMTPSSSLPQITSPGSSISSLTAVTPISSAAANDTIISRPPDDMTLSPMLQLENSLTLTSSSSSGGLQSSSRNHSILIQGLSEKLISKPVVQVNQPILPLELQALEPLVVPQASPTRERSPDVISSASTAMSQDIPEIASETLQRSYTTPVNSIIAPEVADTSHHADSMNSAASALHLLSLRNRPNSEHGLRSLDIGSPDTESDRISAPSLLENALPQDNVDGTVHQPWPAAPDITRETRNSLLDSSRDDSQDRGSTFHRHSYHLLQQHDSQDASAEQSDHDDEVASLASSSGNFGGKGQSQRIPVKDWKSKVSPRSSPKLRRKSKKDEMCLLSLLTHLYRIAKCLEPVTGQLSSTIATKLTAVEGSLKENVSKMIKSKNMTDAIGRAAADVLQVPIQSAYREAFQSIVLPAFEKGCQSMFQQINCSFKQGTQEYMQQLETHLKTRKAHEQEARDPLVTQLQQLIESLQSTTEQLSTSINGNVRSEVQHQLHAAVGNMQDSILTQVQRIIKEEVSTAMKEQQAAVTSSIMQAMRSAAGTPIPSSHMDFQSQQAHILQLMQQGHLNEAFQQALTASDLNLILYVCETVDPQQVFGQHPCPLTQPVLLSLIQQLSFDLGSRTQLKLNYLEDAVMHLDHSDPVTRDHMGTVMNQVRQKLFQFLQAEPHNPLHRPARRLMMMLQGLVPSNMS